MAMWQDKHVKGLVKLLKKAKDTPDAYKHIGELGKEFRESLPYNGRCTKCEAVTFTDDRILNKARKIVTQANKQTSTKDKLAIPPTKEAYKRSQNNRPTAEPQTAISTQTEAEKLDSWING